MFPRTTFLPKKHRALPATLIGIILILSAFTTMPADAVGTAPIDPGPDVQSACGPVPDDQVRCFAEFRAPHASFALTALPDGYGPADLQAAYALPGTPAPGSPTVAVVDAFDDPNAEADLAVYRATYGLAPCTAANGCFRKINQRGDATSLPPSNSRWAAEISLDLDMISAGCPSCKIVLVEADDAGLSSTAAAEDTAAAQPGVVAISNSFGAVESPLMTPLAHSYDHRGIAIVASTGDSGFRAAQWPAVFTTVTAVGGTTLTRAPNDRRGWTETAWSGAGSGCSAFIRKPAWQHDKHCSMRTIADVSAVADPVTGVAAYDTFHAPGWLVEGGTSASAPIIASIYAQAGDTSKIRNASRLYRARNRQFFTDVVGGSNATSQQNCGGDYICTGVPGYDGPTGVGTPWTAKAF